MNRTLAAQRAHKLSHSSTPLNDSSTDHDGATSMQSPMKQWVCSLCDKGFSAKVFLKNHINRHLNQRGFKCPLCEQSFVDRGNLKSHMKVNVLHD